MKSTMTMDTEVVKAKLGALHQGDENVTEMLSTLDTQLQAWMTSMRSGQALIVAALKRYEQLAEEDARMRELPAEPEPAKRSRMFQTSETDEQPAKAAPAGKVYQPDPVAPAVENDDEALLATLDEETLNQIRIRRRLSGKQRGVRELLAEIEEQRRSDGGDQ